MKVEFSEHALERADQRLPRMGLKAIAREIDDAIYEGRVSRDAPAWTMGRFPQAPGREFCWTPCGRRVYVLCRRQHEYVILVTILRGLRMAA
jgi:hypothetical protein